MAIKGNVFAAQKKYILPAFLLFFFIPSFSQTYPGKYWIQFTDKNNSPFSLTNPSQYLSAEAINRRVMYGISVQMNDLPVNPQYIDSILTVPGIMLFHQSKWLNAITVSCTDTNAINTISGWGFVAQVRSCQKLIKQTEKEFLVPYAGSRLESESDTWYAESFNQLKMLNGHLLHAMGYDGSGVKIAVLDAGFPNVPQLDIFQSALSQGRINGGYDFSDMEPDVFDDTHIHGSLVLSTMASYLPGKFIGTAPGATYYLFVTENGEDEYLIEEDNWIAAAEYADSMGVHIINTSLGYTTFDDSTQDHTYADMDGNSTRISIAADIASSKGILCVNSAGNSGAAPWFYIGAPADADSVLAVGAVASDGSYAPFSSKGPSSDGDVKPNVMAQGWGAWFVWTDGVVGAGSGTSFSSPITAGMAACLWQAFPSRSNMEIKTAIEQSASQYNSPDSLMGYGIPDFYKAWQLLGGSNGNFGQDTYLGVFPNPFRDELNIDIHSASMQSVSLKVHDVSGKILYEKTLSLEPLVTNRVRISDEVRDLPTGIYAVTITGNDWEVVEKVIRF
ncbi:MAG: S8 family serine peptidase [Bacteroidota bacterium]